MSGKIYRRIGITIQLTKMNNEWHLKIKLKNKLI